GMRRWPTVATARRQLEVRAGPGQREKDAVVPIVIAKAADLRQPNAIAIERDDLVQALGVARHAQLHRRQSCTRTCPRSTRSARKSADLHPIPASRTRALRLVTDRSASSGKHHLAG